MSSDGIVDLKPQRARDERTGAEVYNVDRETVGYEIGGRRWLIPAEHAPGAMAVWVVAEPRWSDGTPLDAADVEAALDVVRRVAAHWGASLDVVGATS